MSLRLEYLLFNITNLAILYLNYGLPSLITHNYNYSLCSWRDDGRKTSRMTSARKFTRVRSTWPGSHTHMWDLIDMCIVDQMTPCCHIMYPSLITNIITPLSLSVYSLPSTFLGSYFELGGKVTSSNERHQYLELFSKIG